MMRINKRRGILALLLPLGLLTGALIDNGLKANDPVVAPDAAQLQIPSPVQLSNSFSKLAKQLEPSVVQISATVERPERNRGFMPFDDDWMQRFFGPESPFGFQQPPNRRQQPQQRPQAQVGGSGFIVDKNGYILTNNHVVEDATRVQVTLHDDPTKYTAKVIGSDPELDLAVLKIDAGKPLQPAKIANSDGVQVGDWAVAIGSPFGLEATVTAGIISATGRDLGDPDHGLQRFLQTDAAINPGNSGGPLLNINGEVIGVNTMIATRSGAFDGVGFALPMNLAVNSYNQIIKTGRVSRGAIGIQFQRNQTPELLKAYGISNGDGVFVSDVTPGTPAESAGIKAEDVIVAFNGKPVKDGEQLVNIVSAMPVGTKVPVTLLRDGKKMDVTLEVGDREKIVASNRGGQQRGGQDSEEGAPVKFGLSVQNLTSRDRQEMSFREEGGVEVTSVDPSSLAEDMGILQGDVITSINRQPVNSVEDVREIAAKLKPGDPVAFRVMRNVGGGAQAARGGASWQALYLAGTLPRASK